MSPPMEQNAVDIDQVRLNQQSQISLQSKPEVRSASEIKNPLTMNQSQSVEQAAEQMPAAPEQTQNDK